MHLCGGYTHANWIYTGEILENITSFDFTSSYPYVMVSEKYPSSEFRKCNIKNLDDMIDSFAYLLVVRFYNIKCKYYNNFISESKCKKIKGGKFDNGRVISADELEIVLTDIDFKFIIKTYECEYEFIETYFAKYNYLPELYINFVLDKYVKKTEYKDVEGKELNYIKEKNRFNALYGMSVTNTIRDEVIFDELGWHEEEINNAEIIEKLRDEKNKSFLSFSYGVWVTAWARKNLLENVIKLDEYVVYCDTDSIKLKEGFDKNVICEYNKSVKEKIKNVSSALEIDIKKYKPKDKKGNERMLGLFENDGIYKKFITQGAKKYCYIKEKENKKIKNTDNIIKKGKEKSDILEITVAGVPKCGAKELKKIEEFRDDLVFHFENTNKNLLIYNDEMSPILITDYLGNKEIITEKHGCVVLPTTYILGKSEEYSKLISDDSTKRARFKE